MCMFRKAQAHTKHYQNPAAIVLFIVYDWLCRLGLIRLYCIWLEGQGVIRSALTIVLFELHRKLLFQDKLGIGDFQNMS